MEKEDIISIDELCIHYRLNTAFINSLQEAGLIQLSTEGEMTYLRQDDLKDLEKLVRLHNDLDMDAGAIETIYHLLGRISELEDRLYVLQQRLAVYE